MARNHRDWEALGQAVQDIIDQAVFSQDYQKLNQTIRQVVDRAVDLGSEAVRKTVDGVSRPGPQGQEPVSRSVPEQKLPTLYGRTGGKMAGGILKIVGGSLLSCLTLALLITMAALSHLMGSGGTFGMLLAAVGGGIGAHLIGSGVRTLTRISRFKTYCKTLGTKTHCTLEKLAKSVGKSLKFTRKELRRMIRTGYFPEGHLDAEETLLITSDESYRYFEQSRLALEQRQREAARQQEAPASPHSPQVQEILNKGDAFVAQIRRCNDAIPGEEISRKIHRMELIVERIFDRVEAHPENIQDLKKMMDYYLPMTVKLLTAYADMDAQPVQGQTILNSKKEIENTLDTLNLAFEKLLDDLFAETALDVSSDISVLNTLLTQEGLKEDGFSAGGM